MKNVNFLCMFRCPDFLLTSILLKFKYMSDIQPYLFEPYNTVYMFLNSQVVYA